MAIKYVLGYGLGVDSTAILLRWYFEPWTMPCKPEELLVITAMTGDEWQQTGHLVKKYMIPLLQRAGIRYVQVARKGPSRALDGYAVLSDSRATRKLYLRGRYKLSDEMNDNGTVPQVGGVRKCSIKAKGEPLDDFLADELGGAPFMHAIGFEANEIGRAVRDAKCNTSQRTGCYPLIEWGWDRAKCEAYIFETLGVWWIKSACTFCPFALANKEGQARVKDMYSCEPASGVGALVMEYRSVSLNPNQGLMKAGSLLAMLRGTGQHNAVLRAFAERLAGMEWRIYEVERVAMPTQADPSKGVWNRSVRSIAAGTREEMLADLAKLAAAEGTTVEKDDLGVSRAYLKRRGEGFPAREHVYVVAPAGVRDKAPKAFHTARQRYLAAAA